MVAVRLNCSSTLKTPLIDNLRALFASSREGLLVVSPFISQFGLQTLRESIGTKKTDLAITMLTCISVGNLSSGSLDIQALSEFCAAIPACRIKSLPGLHAKAYVADLSKAVVTSANLTYGGLKGNYEYGLMMTDKGLISAIHRDMLEYSALGADLQNSDLQELACVTKDLRTVTSAVKSCCANRLLGRDYRTRWATCRSASSGSG